MRVIISCLIAVLAGPSVRGVELPMEMRAAFEANAASLSPLEVTWKCVKSSPVGQTEFLKTVKYPAYAGIDLFAPMSLVYRQQGDMQYQRFEGKITRTIPKVPTAKVDAVPYGVEKAFSRGRAYNGDSEKPTLAARKQPVLVIDRHDNPKMSKPDVEMFKSQYLRAAGYWTPQYFNELGRPTASTVLHLLESGAKLVSVRSRSFDSGDFVELVIDDSRKVLTIVCDPAKGYALRRQVDTFKETGGTASVVECDDFVKLKEPSFWLPRRCQIKHYTWHSIEPKCTREPLFVETLTVETFKTSTMPDEDFIVKYATPGSQVYDSTVPEAISSKNGIISYEIGANFGELDSAIDQAAGRLQSGPSTRAWLILANVLAVVILISALLWRRRRAAA